MPDLIKETAGYLINARRAVALTGAGISVESGIPPFRGEGGLWEKYDPMEFAHINAFMRNPEKVWKIFMADMKKVLLAATPNDAHLALAKLEALGIVRTVITQNVDGLHQAAGNKDVIEFHGNFAWLRCLSCGHRVKTVEADLAQVPPKCGCGGIFRPECVFFGEMIPKEALTRSQEESSRCDVMLVIGTSALVQPAAFMPVIAREAGAAVIEINPAPTPLTGRVSKFLIEGKAGEIMRAILLEVEHLMAAKRQ